MSDALGPGWAPKKPPPNGDPEPAPKPKRFWWRFTLAAVLIVAVSAATTATATLLYLDSIANAIAPKNDKLQKKLNRFLADAGDGGASLAARLDRHNFGHGPPVTSRDYAREDADHVLASAR